MSIKHFYPVTAAFAVSIACAPAHSNFDPVDSPTSAPRWAEVLTAEEITNTKAEEATAYEAISRLRPNWLAPHGVTSFSKKGTAYAIVYMDDQKYGDLNMLKNFKAFQVSEIRYYDFTQAGARFGVAAGNGGVIEVKSKF
jgi:hypothetical protein